MTGSDFPAPTIAQYSLSPALVPRQMLREERSHERRDGLPFRFQSEVARVEQVVLQRLQVTLVGFGSGWREDLVVLPPRDQHRRLMNPEIVLPLRIQRRVAAVAEKEIELDLVVPLSIE